MKTLPYHPRRKPKNTLQIWIQLAAALVFLAAIMALTSCQLTVGSDGSRTWSVSGKEAAEAIIIISEK